jgi:hypothetical protein
MSEITVSGPFGELIIHREVIDVTSSLPKPDPKWTYTDQHGHEHHYDNGYPTLVTVVDETYLCADCNSEHQDTHLECPLCHEAIEPGTIGPSGFREFAPGRMSATLDGEPISQERAEEILNSMESRRGE